MRNLVLLLIGMMLGGALFHVYYLRLDPLARCSWDHPLDAEAKARCRDAAAATSVHGYAVKARRDLDSLIGRVAH